MDTLEITQPFAYAILKSQGKVKRLGFNSEQELVVSNYDPRNQIPHNYYMDPSMGPTGTSHGTIDNNSDSDTDQTSNDTMDP